MANRPVNDAHHTQGTNLQYLVEKKIRNRIYESKYWKEECFGLTAELLANKAMDLRSVGGVYGSNIKPTLFLCLTLKMLQIQPEKNLIIEFIKNVYFKYVRVLGALYMRLTGTTMDCYKYLEPLYNDNRKIRIQNRKGDFEFIHVDEFIDELLHSGQVCDIILPRLQKDHMLEEIGLLELPISDLEEEMEDVKSSEEEEMDQDQIETNPSEYHRLQSYKDPDRGSLKRPYRGMENPSPKRRKIANSQERCHSRSPRESSPNTEPVPYAVPMSIL
ncbi:pre-mRNA-splicing factor 38A-like [Antechinus flavipes]|uniref:pre-mRNA-splicing factor 38A-like n=1 Tax=Antechinus flavipes TaxID=38775 RepID=UPI002235977C|nr:pre-mRNA-splicing factor 38A-like [Antechinus flavipes]